MEKRNAIIFLKDKVAILLALLLMFVFLYTGINKLTDPDYMAYVLRNYPVYKYLFSPVLSSYWMVYSLVLLEFSVIVAFLFWRLRYALVYGLVILTLYAAGILSLMIENTYFDCGCGLFYTASDPFITFLACMGLIATGTATNRTVQKTDKETLVKKIEGLKKRKEDSG